MSNTRWWILLLTILKPRPQKIVHHAQLKLKKTIFTSNWRHRRWSVRRQLFFSGWRRSNPEGNFKEEVPVGTTIFLRSAAPSWRHPATAGVKIALGLERLSAKREYTSQIFNINIPGKSATCGNQCIWHLKLKSFTCYTTRWECKHALMVTLNPWPYG